MTRYACCCGASTSAGPTPVVLRTRDELLAVLAKDPLGSVATDPSRYVVGFSTAPVPRRS